VPDGRFLKEAAKIMSLDEPTVKMSKSNPNEMSRISLLDGPDKIKKAIMRATTDSDGVVAFDFETKPGVSNLLSIYSAMTEEKLENIVKNYQGKGYGDLKKDLVEIVIEGLRPIQARYEEIRHSQELTDALSDGAKRARAISEKTMLRVKDKFGLGVAK
jgi:tryptophanyl-tRNA synthetase